MKLVSATWIAVAIGLAGCAATEAGEPGTSGGDDGTSSSGSAGSPEGAGVAESTDAQNGPQGCGPAAAVALAESHRLGSALYAISALDAGVLPKPTLLRRDDFQAYFAPPPGSAAGAFGRFFPGGTTDGAPQALLETSLFTAPPATPTPVHLVVVIDESSSMREELALAAGVLGEMTRDGALGASAGDALTVIEWGDEPTVSLDLAAPDADGTFDVAAMVADLESRASTQLAGAPSFDRLERVAGDVVDASSTASHVVMLTDGGFEIDAHARDAIASLSRRGAIVSLVELHGLAESTDDAMPFRPELAATFAGGTHLFLGSRVGVTPSELAPTFHDRFGELFRVRRTDAIGSLYADGFRLVPVEPEPVGAETSGVSTAWIGDGGLVTMRANMVACAGALGPEVAVVAGLLDDASSESPFTARAFDAQSPDLTTAAEARVARSAFVDRLVDLLEAPCDLGDTSPFRALGADVEASFQATTLEAGALAEHQAVLARMKEWLLSYQAVCQP
jgi:hypothetical protein